MLYEETWAWVDFGNEFKEFNDENYVESYFAFTSGLWNLRM